MPGLFDLFDDPLAEPEPKKKTKNMPSYNQNTQPTSRGELITKRRKAPLPNPFIPDVNEPGADARFPTSQTANSMMPNGRPQSPATAGAGVAPPAPDPFTTAIAQFFMGRSQGAGGAPTGPNFGDLVEKLRKPDLTHDYNVGSGLPSGAGSMYNPFNNGYFKPRTPIQGAAPTPAKKPTPFGASANPKPGFNFGVGNMGMSAF